jgi:hypothetical protein
MTYISSIKKDCIVASKERINVKFKFNDKLFFVNIGELVKIIENNNR